MSLRSMAVVRADVENSSARVGQPAAAQEQSKLLDQLIKLIPGDAIALFLLLLALFADSSYQVRWGILGGILVLTPIWVFVNYKEKATEPAARRKVPWLEMVVGTVGFAAWAATIPSTPYLQIDWFTLEIGAGIAAGVSALLTLVVRIPAALKPLPG